MTHAAEAPTTFHAEAMTDLLRRTGDLPSGVEVVDVAREPLSGGYLADMARLTLTYSSGGTGGAGMPRTLVLKQPSRAELPRTVGTAMGMYRREVTFYRRLASRTGVRTPRCYHSELDEEGSGGFALLLEDVAGAVVRSQDEACPEEDLLLALEQAARLHASHWDQSGLADEEWLIQLTRSGVRPWHALYEDAWQRFQSWEGVRLSPRLTALGDALAAASVDTWIGGYDGPWALVHADFHLGNLLYRHGNRHPENREVVLVDWQLLTHASPLVDVAFLLGRLPTHHRRRLEMALLEAYHGMLSGLGVTGYTWSDCRRDYARWLWFGVLNAVIASTAYPIAADQLHRHVTKIQRFLTQALDHESVRYLR